MPNVSGVIQEFFEHKGKEFISDIYNSSQVAKLVRNYPAIDGNLTLPTASIEKALMRGYDGKTDVEDDTIVIEGVTLSTTMHKFVIEMDLGDETMRGYKNYLKEQGLSADDLSVVQYFMIDAQVREKMGEEIDEAAFLGKAIHAANLGKPMVETVSGFRRLIKAGAALATPRVHVHTTGAIDETNAVAKISGLYRATKSQLQNAGAAIIVGFNTYNNYRENYFTSRGNNPASEAYINNTDFMGTKFHLGAGKSFIIPFAGMGDDDAVFITPLSNLAYLYDVDAACANLKIQEDGFKHRVLTRMPVGFGVRKMSKKMVVCNDRLIATS